MSGCDYMEVICCHLAMESADDGCKISIGALRMDSQWKKTRWASSMLDNTHRELQYNCSPSNSDSSASNVAYDAVSSASTLPDLLSWLAGICVMFVVRLNQAISHTSQDIQIF